jgi:hypothetical protein
VTHFVFKLPLQAPRKTVENRETHGNFYDLPSHFYDFPSLAHFYLFSPQQEKSDLKKRKKNVKEAHP